MMAPNLTSRVTEYVPVIIQFIQGIMDKGHAYVGADGIILFLHYINMPSIKRQFSDRKSMILFSYTARKHKLWVHFRTAQLMPSYLVHVYTI